MDSKKTKKYNLSEKPLSDLLEKKSERTTFKLMKEATEDLQWLQDQYKISAKELFDYLCSKFVQEKESPLCDCIIRETKGKPDEQKEVSLRKTYVLSRGAIRYLSEIAKKNGLSRDMLVSKLISAFKNIIMSEIEEEQKNQKQIHDLLNNFYFEAIKTKEALKNNIHGSSTIEEFSKILVSIEKLVTKSELQLSSGKGN